MWKCVSRSFRSIIFQSQCSYQNVSSREARSSNSNGLLKFSPMIFSRFNRAYGYEKRNSCGHFSKDGGKREDPRTERDYNLEDSQNLFDALRWSSIFVIGWYLLQPFSHRKAIFNPQLSDKCTFSIFSKYTQNEYFKLVDYFKNGIQPFPSFHSILPVVNAKKTKSKCRTISSEELDKSKLDDLEKAHHRVIGTLSNYMGAKCMENRNYKEAFSHFQEGAQVNNPAAIFNVGLCHEMGYGTAQDFKKAAEMYRKASDLGHATAMYNLGVFYVNGWGELPLDFDEARKLFKSAADLGQTDALRALELEKNDNGLALAANPSKADDSKPKKKLLEEKSTKKCNATYVKPEDLFYFPIIRDSLKEKKNIASEDDCGTFDLSLQSRFGALLV